MDSFLNTESNKFQRTDWGLNNVDRITILYVLLTTLLLILGSDQYENITQHYLTRLVMLLFIWLIIWLGKEFPGRVTYLFHHLYPLIFLSYFFPETDYLNNIFMTDLDPGIIRLELSIFGIMPSEVFSSYCSQAWFSELMHLGYFSFYLIITFFVGYYYIKLPELAEKRVFIFFLSFYLFYLIFIFSPSAGPQYFLPASDSNVPKGYLFTDIMKEILLYGDKPTGAFPSSHIGMTWLMMYFFFVDNRKVFLWWLIPALVLTFSTVYIKAHYAVDVLAGFLIVPLFIWLGDKVYNWFLEYYTSTVRQSTKTKTTTFLPFK